MKHLIALAGEHKNSGRSWVTGRIFQFLVFCEMIMHQLVAVAFHLLKNYQPAELVTSNQMSAELRHSVQ